MWLSIVVYSLISAPGNIKYLRNLDVNVFPTGSAVISDLRGRQKRLKARWNRVLTDSNSSIFKFIAILYGLVVCTMEGDFLLNAGKPQSAFAPISIRIHVLSTGAPNMAISRFTHLTKSPILTKLSPPFSNPHPWCASSTRQCERRPPHSTDSTCAFFDGLILNESAN